MQNSFNNLVQLPPKGARIVVLGLGKSGLAMARYYLMLNNDYKIEIIDQQNKPEQLAVLEKYKKIYGQAGAKAQVKFKLVSAKHLVDFDYSPYAEVGRSSGIRLSEFLLSSSNILSDLDIFNRAYLLAVQAQPERKQPWLLGITGTNAKTSLVSSITECLNADGCTALSIGNIGYGLLDAWCDWETKVSPRPTVAVAELSSFQLTAASLDAWHIGCIANFSQDHLDWHESVEEYAQSKLRIYHGLPLGACIALSTFTDGMAKYFCQPDSKIIDQQETEVTLVSDRIYLLRKQSTKVYQVLNILQLADDKLVINHNQRELQLVLQTENQSQLALANTVLRRSQTVNQNVLLAFALYFQVLKLTETETRMQIEEISDQLTASVWRLQDLLATPGQHRCEMIAKVSERWFINDSKSTNYASVAYALGRCTRPLVLIAGGLSKGQDFARYLHLDRQQVRFAVLIGTDNQTWINCLQAAQIDFKLAVNLEDAIELALMHSEPDDIVLFSPGCSSLDQYANYVQRGNNFIAQVLGRQVGESPGLLRV